MAKTINYILVNDIIKFAPIQFEREVNNQQDIEDLKRPLEQFYNLDAINEKILKENEFSGIKKNIYQILFSIRQPIGGLLQP